MASGLTTLGLVVMVMANVWQAENDALPPLASAKPDSQKFFCLINGFGHCRTHTMNERKEYTDDQGRKFCYDHGSRVYVDGSKDTGSSVKSTPGDNLEGFTRQGPAWHKSVPLTTAYGNFDVQLLGGKPDEQMVRLAASATEYVQKNIEHLVDVVFAHYQWAVKTWGQDAVHDLGMPKKVDRQTILSCIPDRAIMVDRIDDDEYLCCIRFEIPYDPEHGLQLEFEDGNIITINDSGFTIVDGCLKFD